MPRYSSTRPPRCWFVALTLSFALAGQAASYTLENLLDRYRAAGFEFVYSSEVVDTSVLLEMEGASSRPGIKALEDALALVGLGLVALDDRVYSLVRRAVPVRVPVRVIDATGDPIAGASVRAGNSTASTDADGLASLLVTEAHSITVSHPRFDPATGRLAPGAGVTIRLTRNEVLDNVVVTASRYELSAQPQGSHQRLRAAEMLQTPAFAEDSTRIVHRLPGASSIGVSSKPRIRGGFANEVLVLFDGVELIEPFHLRDFQALFSAFNPGTIDSIEYYTGGFPARYGNRMSGVLDIATRDAFGSPGGEVGISTFNSSVLLHTASADADWLLSARRGNLDLVLKQVNPNFGKPKYHDLFGRAGFERKHGRFEISAFRFFDNIALAQDDVRARSTIRNDYLWASAEYEPRPGLAMETVVTVGAITGDRSGSADETARVVGALTERRHLRLGAIKQDLDWNLADGIQLTGGLNLRWYDMRYNTTLTAERGAMAAFLGLPASIDRRVNLDLKGESADLYATLRYPISDTLTIQPGLRLDYQTWSPSGGIQVSPRFSLLYQPRPRLSFRASYGDFHQPQAIYELSTADGETRPQRVQRANHWIAGAEFHPGPLHRFSVEVYHKRVSRQHRRYVNLFNPYMLVPELEADRVALAARRAFARGLEVSATRIAGDHRWNWTVNYAYHQARDRENERWVPRRFEQRHTVNAISNWRLGRWNLSVAAAWHTGWGLTLLPAEVPLNDPYDAVAERHNARMRAFATIDARLSFEQPLRRGSLTAFFEVTNIVNRTNDGGVDYEIAIEDDLFILEETDLEPIFPLVSAAGVVWRF